MPKYTTNQASPVFCFCILFLMVACSSFFLIVGFALHVVDGSSSVGLKANETLFPSLRRIHQQSADRLQNWTRINNVDVLESMEDDVSLCHIVDLDFYSMINFNGERITIPGDSMRGASAIALAIEHLNSGDGSVVPELDGLNQRCKVRFSTEFLDTAMSPFHTVNQVLDTIGRENRKPCAFLGAGLSKVSMASATVTGLYGYPQLSWISISAKLNDEEQFPLFARLSSPSKARAVALLKNVYSMLGARYLALIYPDDPAALGEMNSIQECARKLFSDMVVEPIPYTGIMTENTAKSVVESLKGTNFTYVYVAVKSHELEPLLVEAYDQGIAGTGHQVWMFSQLLASPNGGVIKDEFTPEDPLFKVLRGALRFGPVIGAPGLARYDAFLEAWRKIGTYEDDIDYLRSMLPKYEDDPTYQPMFGPSTFENPGSYFSVAYDATVLLGLAACGTSTHHFTGEQMYASMLNTSFVGATGLVGLDPDTRARVGGATMIRLLNTVAMPLANGNFALSEVGAGFYNGTDWALEKDVIFNDGSNTPPPDLPPVKENLHHLSDWVRGFGFFMSGFVVVSSAAMSLWAYAFAERARVIRAAQPLFLHLICLGTALMGFSIVPLAFDDNFASEEKASKACMVFPWLLALGWCIAFSALFSKTMRVNKLFHNPSFRRVTVTVSDVIKPMALLLTANVLILVLWTCLSPLKFERIGQAYDEFGRETESYGDCRSDNQWWFFAPLATANFLALFVANQQAYVARKLSTEFAESDYVARAMSLILVVALLVVPVAVIAGVNPNMHFFISVSFVSTVALSLLFYIFVPKILYRPEKNRSLQNAVHESLNASSSREPTLSWKTNEDASGSRVRRTPESSVGEVVLLHPKLVAVEEVRNQQLAHENAWLVDQVAALQKRVSDLVSATEESGEPKAKCDPPECRESGSQA